MSTGTTPGLHLQGQITLFIYMGLYTIYTKIFLKYTGKAKFCSDLGKTEQ